MNIPVARQIPYTHSIHGDNRNDEYYWLNDRENPEVIAYLKAENEYTNAQLADVADLRETLFKEITSRIKADDESVPYMLRGYYYYSRYEAGKEYPMYCRRCGSMDAPEEIILDVNILAQGHSYCNVGGMAVSPDNRYLVYGIDTVSRRLYTLKVKDLVTGETLAENIVNTSGDAAWANDNRTFFYTLKDTETLRECTIVRHRLGTPEGSDVQVFHEADESFTCEVHKTKTEQYLLIASSSTVSDEYRYLDANTPEGEFCIVEPRRRDFEYSVDHKGDWFYILTNDEAVNFRLMRTPVQNTGKEFWEEVIPHCADVLLDEMELFDDFMVIAERANASSRLRVIRLSDKTEHLIAFDEEVYEVAISINTEMNSTVLRFEYSSLTTPNSVFDYNMKTRTRRLLKQQEIPGGFDASWYESKRLFAVAADGTRIPMSVVYRKGIELNGQNPTLLYGYGSYGISIDPYFGVARLSLLDRGFVFAIAHIRGGQELGRPWYEDGKMLKKKNTFTDFIASAEHLIDLKYTDSQHLCAMGGSAGGLLMGAVVNLRPDLFKGIIAAVPFVDVVTTMLDEEIPLTTGEYDEWGNPNELEYYTYMKSYSPYDNVEAKAYPNMLVTTGLHDSQVQYWEPAKWVARLRRLKTDRNLLLLYTNMDAGHGGASGRYERYLETALEYTFLIKVLNN
jgi:oligopeptidase B